MKPLSSSEQRLLVLLLIILFGVGQVVLYRWFTDFQKKAQLEEVKIAQQKMEAKVWLEEKELWLQRQQWIQSQQPGWREPGLMSSDLLDFLQKSAKMQGLEIQDQQVLEPEILPQATQVAARLKLVGKMEKLTRWMAELQKPESFYAVLKFTVKSDADPTKVVAEVLIARWHQSKTK